MSHSDHSPFSREIAALTEWWHEAGVDTCFDDDPTVWLTEEKVTEKGSRPAVRPTQAPEPAKPEPLAKLAGGETNWPTELAAFQEWFSSQLANDVSGRTGVTPVGSAGARLMVIVPEPEMADTDRLLSGDNGRYLQSILAASGITPDEVYFASALPAAMPHPDWQDLQQRGLGDILKLHIKLAAPKRIIVLGSSVLPLIGNIPAQGPAEIQKYQQDSNSMPLFAAWQIERLRQRSAARKRFWKTWLDWIASDD